MDRFGRKNNYWLGKKLPPETVEKIRLARSKQIFSEETKLKMSISHIGKKASDETKRKMSLIHKGNKYCLGRIPWNKGLKGIHLSPKSEYKKGRTPWMKGRKHKPETIEKIKRSLSGKLSREKNPAWNGGISKKPYPFEFTKELKEKIRQRDGMSCFLCGVHQENCKRVLAVHHIDYDKNNISFKNLVTLCYSCHGKTMHKRNYWANYFKEALCRQDG